MLFYSAVSLLKEIIEQVLEIVTKKRLESGVFLLDIICCCIASYLLCSSSTVRMGADQKPLIAAS